jgi:hypothetical protein
MAEATFDGSILHWNRLFHIQKLGSEEAFRQALERNAHPSLRTAYSPVSAITRYPAEIYRCLYDFMLKTFGAVDAFREAAAFCAFNDLGRGMKMLMWLGSPAMTAQKLAAGGQRYFSVGGYQMDNITSKSCRLTERGHTVYGLGSCQGTEGWTRKALEYAGARNLKITHQQCEHQGADACVMLYTWE